jgi:hypothetical protein
MMHPLYGSLSPPASVADCAAAPSVTTSGNVQQPVYAYMLAPQDLSPGDTVQSGANAPIKPGNTMPLKDIPVGMPINSIELHPNKGGQLCRAAGCMATIVNKQQEHAIVRLPSGVAEASDEQQHSSRQAYGDTLPLRLVRCADSSSCISSCLCAQPVPLYVIL